MWSLNLFTLRLQSSTLAITLWEFSLYKSRKSSYVYMFEEGSYLLAKRNSPESERIENAPLVILISTKQFNSMLVLGVIRRECAPFQSFPLYCFISTSAPPLTDMRPHYSILSNQCLTAKCKFSNMKGEKKHIFRE